MSEFDEYIVHGDPGHKEKADAWQTAIGLQDVDGLKVSVNRVLAKAYFQQRVGTPLTPPRLNMKIDEILRHFILTGEIE